MVEHERWAECLRTCTRHDGVENTPFRRMIRKMPGTCTYTLYTCTSSALKELSHRYSVYASGLNI